MGFEQVTATTSVGSSVQAGKHRFVTLKNGNISISQAAYQALPVGQQTFVKVLHDRDSDLVGLEFSSTKAPNSRKVYRQTNPSIIKVSAKSLLRTIGLDDWSEAKIPVEVTSDGLIVFKRPQ